jgi:hypothetical protein
VPLQNTHCNFQTKKIAAVYPCREKQNTIPFPSSWRRMPVVTNGTLRVTN